MGIDQPEATALALVNRRIGNANFEYPKRTYFCQQIANTFPSLDGIKNWLKIVKEQPIAFAEALDLFLELFCCPESQPHA
jgi:hypothetical protein